MAGRIAPIYRRLRKLYAMSTRTRKCNEGGSTKYEMDTLASDEKGRPHRKKRPLLKSTMPSVEWNR